MDDIDDLKPTFMDYKSLMSLPVPTTKPSEEYKHTTQKGFFVRVMRRTRDGNVRRTYLHRYKETVSDGKGGFKKIAKKEELGLAAPLEEGDVFVKYDDAFDAVRAARKAKKSSLSSNVDTPPRMTVESAFAFYGTEKQTNRPTTVEKDAKTYTRYFSHIKSKFLDELDYGFWAQFVHQCREGTLVVGRTVDDAGVEQPLLRGPCAPDTLIGIMNVAILLYDVAGPRKGFKVGVEKDFNPARDAKKLIADSVKRESHIPLDKLGRAWNASGQLCAPWWRDLFRMYLLTGLRYSLMVNMRFDEIDWKDGSYVFPANKQGTKRRGRKINKTTKPIRMPLSNAALEILKARREFASDRNGWVWYAHKPLRGRRVKPDARLADPRSSWIYIEDAIGNFHFSAHDLRRTFATAGGACLDDLFAMSLLMLHSPKTLAKAVGLPEITVDYIQTGEAQQRMRRAANKIADYMQGLARGEDLSVVEGELPQDIEEALAEGP